LGGFFAAGKLDDGDGVGGRERAVAGLDTKAADDPAERGADDVLGVAPKEPGFLTMKLDLSVDKALAT
jgi:hypothetical protein